LDIVFSYVSHETPKTAAEKSTADLYSHIKLFIYPPANCALNAEAQYVRASRLRFDHDHSWFRLNFP
jgi:hypothetical protein